MARGFPRWRPSRRAWLGHLLLAPGLLVTLFLIVYPLALATGLSFQKLRLMRIGAPRLPFTTDNYARLVRSADFWHATLVTLVFVVIVTAACFAVGMAAALLVNRDFPGRRIARLLVALPWAVPEVVAAAIWSWIFDGSFGLVNWLLLQAGLIDAPLPFLSQPHAAFAVCCVVLTWSWRDFRRSRRSCTRPRRWMAPAAGPASASLRCPASVRSA
jgi:multiple sugar transport system permease protein